MPTRKTPRAKTVKIITEPVHEVTEKSFQLSIVIISVLGGAIIAGGASWFLNHGNVTRTDVNEIIANHPVTVKEEQLSNNVDDMTDLLKSIDKKVTDGLQQNAALKQQVDDQNQQFKDQIRDLREEVKDAKKK